VQRILPLVREPDGDPLARYLALKPEAIDAPIVRGYLAELGTP